MSDKDYRAEEAPGADDAEVSAAQGASAGVEAQGETEALRRELEETRARASEHWDRLVRTSAELDNVRKRAERDIEAARKYGLERFATDLLAVRDSLEMGLASARETRETSADDKHAQGMELTLKMLSGVMEKYGISVIDPQGEAFNPELHEAMSAQESTEAAPNTVLNVMQKGYRLQDRLLRPAMVIVARAPRPDDDAGGSRA